MISLFTELELIHRESINEKQSGIRDQNRDGVRKK